jgi:hypothetical protein
MDLIKGRIEEVETYREIRIVFEHNLNILRNTTDIHTLCGLGRQCRGPIESVREFIDAMFEEYGDEEDQ